MPEYLAPGVYVEEIPNGPRPIEGVTTSTAGFAGLTERGPLQPRLVTSWTEYAQWFGDTIDATISFLPLAVRGFFDNGGQKAFIARIAGNGAAAASLDLPTNDANSVLRLKAIGPGDWGNRILVRVQTASPNGAPPEDCFRVTLLYYRDGIPSPFVDPIDPANELDPQRRDPDVLEDFDNLSADAAGANYVENVVHAASKLVEAHFVNLLGACHAPVSGRPQDVAFNPGGSCGGASSALTGGTSGATATPAEFAGDPSLPAGQRTGLAALASIEEVSLLLAPDEVNDNVVNSGAITDALVGQCELLRDRFAVVSIRQGQSDVRTIVPPRDSSYGAVYYPWVRVFDARSQSNLLMPAVGHVAGIYARSDTERGVHKAPANELVRGLADQDPSPGQEPLEYVITTRELDILNPRGVNTIRDFRVGHHGIRVWGARTMSSDPEWKYLNVRRLFLFVEQSIDRGTQWVAFEPNGEPLWAIVRQVVSNFLVTVWRSGALQGSTPDKAFFVRCDRTTMTQDDIDNGRLICLIGMAPLRPAEFVIFRIGKWTQEHLM